MSTRRVFSVHLALSLLLAGIICVLVFVFWYPAPYFAAKGAWSILAVLLGVHLIAGPMLTLYLYRPGKPGLMIDMVFVVVVQVAALGYGTYVLHSERPYFTVFAVDRFEVVARHEVDFTRIDYAALLNKPLIGPILAVALLPETTAGRQQLLDEVLFQGRLDIDRRPEFWQPHAGQVEHIVANVQNLCDLTARAGTGAQVERLLSQLGRTAEAFGYVPLRGKERDFAFVIDRQTGKPVGSIDVNPWPE